MLDSLLDSLARSRGIGDAYYDYRGELKHFSRETKAAILAAMGCHGHFVRHHLSRATSRAQAFRRYRDERGDALGLMPCMTRSPSTCARRTPTATGAGPPGPSRCAILRSTASWSSHAGTSTRSSSTPGCNGSPTSNSARCRNSPPSSAQIEDLIGMTDPVNVPGTSDEHPNWQRKITSTIEEVFEDEATGTLLTDVQFARSA